MAGKEWKCICGDWVPDRYRAHMHAALADADKPRYVNEPGVEVWKYEREPDRETRDAVGP